jgi:hypothetical protein
VNGQDPSRHGIRRLIRRLLHREDEARVYFISPGMGQGLFHLSEG